MEREVVNLFHTIGTKVVSSSPFNDSTLKFNNGGMKFVSQSTMKTWYMVMLILDKTLTIF